MELLELLKDPAFLAFLSAIFGGVGLKIMESLLGRKKLQVDEAAVIRKELRDDVNGLRQLIRDEKAAGDKWRDDYYKTLEDFYESKRELIDVKARVVHLESEVNEWRTRYYQLWEDMVVDKDADDVELPMPLADSMQAVDVNGRQ